VDINSPSKCEKCGSEKIKQDPDTLDTWFSSALWPFSTLGWPENSSDLKKFYPTNTLVTAYDIIFFWVARMIFSGLEYTDSIPFKDVIIHGIVRDVNGKKMSKSLGNGIDPLDEIEKYGADALRFTLVAGNSTGGDMRYSEDKVVSSRNFCNKLWNANRFLLMNLDEEDFNKPVLLPTVLETEDKWILTKLNNIVKEVNENLEKFEMGIAASKIEDFIWDTYCDWYIELAKSRLQSTGDKKQNVKKMLIYVMNTNLKLLHPFMPFITEEIYSAIPH
ncbi:MAG: class I tRNA ligase family protein, partial [Oscillospiraceae bacterium]